MNRSLRLTLIVLTILTSCCFNVYVLELITKEVPGAGNIITFTQFLFISIEGFFFGTKCLTKRRFVPLKDYLYLVITFFLVSVSSNYALKFNISMPLHMIFKSGSLIANMALGILILKRRYKISKYIAVALITVGIAMATVASAQGLSSSVVKNKRNESDSSSIFLSWLFGIFLLSFSLLASARMGIFQETLARIYGKHPRESMFYCHALPLPGFIFLYRDIYQHAVIFSRSELMSLLFRVSLPKHWVYLVANALAQYVCARSIFTLTTETTSLVVTLIITLRKFLSLLISIYYFSNPFTTYHWIGTFLVFLGTFIFVEVVNVDRLIGQVLKTAPEEQSHGDSEPLQNKKTD